MDEIRSWIEAEGTGHYFFIAFPVALLVLFILLRGRRARFVIPALLMSLVIVNPWFYRYWDGLELYAYWRILWVVPVLAVTAGLIPAIAEKTDKTWLKGIVAAAGVGLVALGGTFLYKGAGGSFTLLTPNVAKLPEYAVEVADYLETLDEHPRAVVQHPIGVYMRQYTGGIDIMYGRNIDGFIQWAGSEAQTIHKQLNDRDGNLELVATTLANNGYGYLVMNDADRADNLRNAGYELLDHVAGYGVYRVHGTPDSIKERNELGQVVSVTRVDPQGNPINGDGGYSKTTYEYDANGNTIREFRTDVDGNGVADLSGRAGYEREFDLLGNVLMECNIDPEGKPIDNSAGYAQVRRVFRGRNLVEEAYYDPEGMLVNRIDARYAMLRIDYDGKHHRTGERYYDVDGALVNSNLGYARIVRQYEDNLLMSEAYFGSDGQPTTTAKGYAAFTRTYDSGGRMLSETYRDGADNPVDCINGYATVVRDYDSANNVIMQRFVAANGTPVVTAAGYAEVRREYSDKKVVREAYFDGEGKPLLQAAGYAAIAQEWNGDVLVSRSYLDVGGNPTLRTDGYAKAVWTQDENDTWNIWLEDLDGAEVSLEGKNLARDIRFGPDGWSEWMTPNPNTVNYCFNIGFANLGPKQEGDVYSSQIEIEFRNVTSTPGQEFWLRTQGAQDGRWFTGNPWNDSLVSIHEAPVDGVYRFDSTVTVSGDMVIVSTFNLSFRCDYWGSGSFRVRNVKVEKGNSPQDWRPGL